MLTRIPSLVVILVCGLVIVSALSFLPELVRDWETEPEGLIGTLLLGAIAAAVATLLALKLAGRDKGWVRQIALVLGVILGATALFNLAGGSWPMALILFCVAIPLLITVKRPKT